MQTSIRRTAGSQRLRDHSTSNTALVRSSLLTRLVLAALACCGGVHRADAGPGTVIVNENFEDNRIDGFTEIPPNEPNSRIETGE